MAAATLQPTGFRLYKREKLCSTKSIDLLFSRTAEGGQAALCYPLRVAWRRNPQRSGAAQFLVVVPKKRLRHAVDRVAMRRLVREAYRLNRSRLGSAAAQPIDIAFIYVADRRFPYRRVAAALAKALAHISRSLKQQANDITNQA